MQKEADKNLRIAGLILRYVNQEITEKEKMDLEEWINERPENHILFQQLISGAYNQQEIKKIREKDPQSAWERVQSKIKDAEGAKRKFGFSIPKVFKMAAAIAGLSILSWILLRKSINEKLNIAMLHALNSDDVSPGKAGAQLMLSNGTIVSLGKEVDSSFQEKGSTVSSLKEGRLIYQKELSVITDTGYNLLQTTNGQEYSLELEDGTRVWLNAGTELSYPVHFNGRERRVSLSGEAYFEVAHNPNRPFKVMIKGLEVKVLGTHFNVNAYEDESIAKTTLLEGSIKLTVGSGSTVIKPGEQVQVNKSAEIKVFEGVNLDQAVAWKNGYFQFKRDKLPDVIRQLTRWYDIKVRYEGQPPVMEFGGRVSRNSNLSEVLKILDISGVRFRIEGKTLVVNH